jgi:hypothetical protein
MTSGAWGLTLAAALLAGTAGWLIGEAFYDYYQPSEEAASQSYDFRALNRETAVAWGRNGAIAFGALGGLLGLALGLAGGASRRSLSGAVSGGLLGLILGGLVGSLPAFLIMPYAWNQRGEDPANLDMSTPLMIHAALWLGLGAVAGLAFGVGRAGGHRATLVQVFLGGLVGAALGTLAYELIGGIGFPMSRTTDPISITMETRLLARLCVSGFTALGVLYALRAGRSPARQA